MDAPFFDNSTNTQCPPGRHCRYPDATQIAIDPGVDLAVGTTYNAEATGDPAITGVFSIPLTFDPFTNFQVRKIGAGTGGTNGTIGQTCQLVNLFEQVPGGGMIDTGNTLLCQAEFNGQAFFGDSGGPVLWLDGQNRLNFLGIIVAGTSHGVNTMSNWSWIWQELYHAGGNVTRLCPVVSPGTGCSI